MPSNFSVKEVYEVYEVYAFIIFAVCLRCAFGYHLGFKFLLLK